ncbi:MAG: MBL fold metallo-hydrolase [Pseudolabrys sp.]
MASALKGPLRPTLYRFRLGGFEVMPVLDSVVVRGNIHESFGGGATADEVKALAAANNIGADQYEHPFVPCVVNTGKEVILFDTGNGTLARDNPALRARLPDGHLLARLGEAGYRPEDIDTVVITHCHPDHIGGLTDGGKLVFPNARLVISGAEFDYWKKGENIREARKANHGLFLKLVAPLEDRFTFIKPGDEIATGVRAVDASGHSAGMTAWQIESEGKRLLIWADTCINYVFPIQHPEWTIDVDDDKDKAVATRKRILAMVAAEKMYVVGYHMPFPSVGWIDTADGGYRWVAASYQMNV